MVVETGNIDIGQTPPPQNFLKYLSTVRFYCDYPCKDAWKHVHDLDAGLPSSRAASMHSSTILAVDTKQLFERDSSALAFHPQQQQVER